MDEWELRELSDEELQAEAERAKKVNRIFAIRFRYLLITK